VRRRMEMVSCWRMFEQVRGHYLPANISTPISKYESVAEQNRSVGLLPHPRPCISSIGVSWPAQYTHPKFPKCPSCYVAGLPSPPRF
jgi:hypothetical protein